MSAVDAQPAGQILPVVGYSPLWLVIGLLLILLVVAYYLLSLLLTRPRPAPQPVPPAAAPRRSGAELQAVYLEQVERIEQLHAAGELSARRAHAELSRTVREFVSEATGVPADRMTLSELRATPFAGAAFAVSEYYPLIFGPDEARSTEHGLHAARQVIALWR